MATSPAPISRNGASIRRSARWLKWLLVAAAAAGAWHLYVSRTPDCASLAHHGATLVNNKYCVVAGALELDGSWNWQRLPAHLVVHGNLTIKGTHIDRLPDGLVVDGDIYLYKTDVDELPPNLWASGKIDQYAGMYAAIPNEELAAWHARRARNPARPANIP